MTMKRVFVLLLAAAMLLCGCSKKPQETEPAPFYRFTDSTGFVVALPEQPKNVAVLFSSYAEIWTLAGGSVNITVGESVDRGFAASDAKLVDDGAGKSINLEQLLAAKPDFVIGSADIPAQVDACKAARDAGIPAALFRMDTFGDYLTILKACSNIVSETDTYDTYGYQVAEQIVQLTTKVSGMETDYKKILFIRAGSQASSTKAKGSDDHFAGQILKELGAHNIADDVPVLLDGLSLEHILQEDPDYIFIVTMGDNAAAQEYIRTLFAQPGWKGLSAIENSHYSFLPRNLFHYKPNQRWAEAYTYLAQILYPELKND